MNKKLKKLLLAGDNVMSEMHLSLDLRIALVDHLLKTNKEYKNSRIFIKTNEIKLAFNMTWFLEILRI